MQQTFRVVASVLLYAVVLRGQDKGWSKWYQDGPGRNLVMRFRCDPIAKETQVEIKNLTEDTVWRITDVHKMIKGHKGGRYDLYPQQSVQLIKRAGDCQKPSGLRFRARADSFKAESHGKYEKIKGASRVHFFLRNGEFSMVEDLALDPYRNSKPEPITLREYDANARREHVPPVSPLGITWFSPPSCGNRPPQGGPETGSTGDHIPEGTVERSPSPEGTAAPLSAPGYVPRSECLRITTYDDVGGIDYYVVATNTCKANLYARVCSLYWPPSQYTCVEGKLAFGQWLIGGQRPPLTYEQWQMVGKRMVSNSDGKCRARGYAWAAEGGEAAKSWVKSHRPDTTMGCDESTHPKPR